MKIKRSNRLQECSLEKKEIHSQKMRGYGLIDGERYFELDTQSETEKTRWIGAI